MDVASIFGESGVARPSGLRGRKRQATRARIARTARLLFDEVGYERARTVEIAERAEVSEATLFRYFPTKADLAVEEVRRAAVQILTALADRPVDETPYEAVLATATPEAAAALVPDGPERMIRLLETDELAARTFFVILEAGERLAADFARRLGRPVESPEAQVLAGAVLGALTRSLRALLTSPEPDDPIAVFRRHVAVLRPVLDVPRT